VIIMLRLDIASVHNFTTSFSRSRDTVVPTKI